MEKISEDGDSHPGRGKGLRVRRERMSYAVNEVTRNILVVLVCIELFLLPFAVIWLFAAIIAGIQELWKLVGNERR